MPIGNTREKSPKPFCEPAKPIPAMIMAPTTTTEIRMRCVLVSSIGFVVIPAVTCCRPPPQLLSSQAAFTLLRRRIGWIVDEK